MELPELVVFDCDGVLVDTETITNTIIAANLTQHGLPVTADECMALFAGGTMLHVMQNARERGADLPDDWADQIYAETFAALAQGVEVIPGAITMVDALQDAGIPVYVASNGPVAKMKITLTPSGLWDRLEGRILSREHHAPKPSPEMVRFALSQTGVPPERAVMVDDMETGCRAGLAAGVRTIGFLADGDPTRLDHLPVEKAADMAAVARMIGLSLSEDNLLG